MNEFEPAIPILCVKNVEDSITYYVNSLGFQSDWEWETPAKFASVSRGKACIFLCQNGQGHPGTWLYIYIDDVDALHKEYQANGARIRQEPTNFEWGRREMVVEDIDGHCLRMSSNPTGQPDGVPLKES